jgi:hypothetical protein
VPVAVGKLKIKNMKTNIFFAFFTSMKKGVGSGSIGQRYPGSRSGSTPKCHGSPTLLA